MMKQDLKCSRCDRERVVSRAVELRQINTRNMSLTSSRKLIELECMDCGHVDTVEPEHATMA